MRTARFMTAAVVLLASGLALATPITDPVNGKTGADVYRPADGATSTGWVAK